MGGGFWPADGNEKPWTRCGCLLPSRLAFESCLVLAALDGKGPPRSRAECPRPLGTLAGPAPSFKESPPVCLCTATRILPGGLGGGKGRPVRKASRGKFKWQIYCRQKAKAKLLAKLIFHGTRTFRRGVRPVPAGRPRGCAGRAIINGKRRFVGKCRHDPNILRLVFCQAFAVQA